MLPPVRKMDAYALYLRLQAVASFSFALIFTINMIYQVETVGLTPLQLVLVGTALEASVFLFEVPTGIVADVFSRRASVLIGYMIIGAGFILEGSIPAFWAVVTGQALWGLGYTFTSGATQAWLSDEIGEANANRAFLRGQQMSQLGALLGILTSVWMAGFSLSLPIRAGGMLFILLGLLLILWMPETGFQVTRSEERSSWKEISHTFRSGLGMIRVRPILATILLIGLFYGLYSEGYDRLWTKHLLDSFSFPDFIRLDTVGWFGIIQIGSLVLAAAAIEVVRRWVNMENAASIARMLLVLTALLVLSLLILAQATGFWVALLCVWMVSITRDLIGPIYTGWVNQSLDSRVRATVISMSSQVDAIGQIAGGPVMGAVGNLFSVRAALSLSGLILSPVLLLFAQAMRSKPAAQFNESLK